MDPVKRDVFLNRWTEHGPPYLRREGQGLVLRLPTNLPNRHFVDTITAAEWELHALGVSSEISLDPCSRLSPWSLYEIALKTGFRLQKLRPVPSWEDILAMTDACCRCRSRVQDRLADQIPMTQDLYQQEESCLIRWKREMRTPRANRQTWPPFHYTVAIIKPSVPHQKSRLIAAKLARFHRVTSLTRTLHTEDILFIYSTAYGEAFTRELLSYHTSGPSEVILLTSPNIVREQASAKRMIREAAGVVDELRNLIHCPDSLGETYATIAHLFGENQVRELVLEWYAAGVANRYE